MNENELVLRPMENKIIDAFTCELMDDIDKYSKINSEYFKSYIMKYDKNHYVIRAYGASRGQIIVDNDGRIQEIELYKDLCFDIPNQIYDKEVLTYINSKKYIGRKIKIGNIY